MQSWEGRFKSQALLDDHALASCMAYVDLNPIRAKIANTPESSGFTSVQQRINARRTNKALPETFEKFVGSRPEEIGIPLDRDEYLALVDWTGRILREGKRGVIDASLSPILERLAITPDAWITLTSSFEQHFNHWVGKEQLVQKIYKDKDYQRIPSKTNFVVNTSMPLVLATLVVDVPAILKFLLCFMLKLNCW